MVGTEVSGESGSAERFVSIPKRVLGWLELLTSNISRINTKVSIPKRVLGWLERSELIDPAVGFLFQSLRGFWVGWNPK